jgi:hypothetical protein
VQAEAWHPSIELFTATFVAFIAVAMFTTGPYVIPKSITAVVVDLE